jgi:hypothetical protein
MVTILSKSIPFLLSLNLSSSTSSLSANKHYRSKFKKEWLTDSSFSAFLRGCKTDRTKVSCITSNIHFSVQISVFIDVIWHIQTRNMYIRTKSWIWMGSIRSIINFLFHFYEKLFFWKYVKCSQFAKNFLTKDFSRTVTSCNSSLLPPPIIEVPTRPLISCSIVKSFKNCHLAWNGFLWWERSFLLRGGENSRSLKVRW